MIKYIFDNNCLWYYNETMTLMLENLNPEQRAAVDAVENGPVLVTAGAGTGKTTVLIAVMASKLLKERKAVPWEILAITFTNKAAREIKARVQEEEGGVNLQWLGTFHSVCLRILRTHTTLAGLQPNFLIYDEDDQLSVIKTLMGASTKKPLEYVEEFSRLKDKGLIAYQSKDKLFNAYNAELQRLNAVDFGDIILRVLKLFNEHPDILSRYQNQFKYILVDEFQDTNNAQMEFLKFLAQGRENPNIYCVGDEDQSIYSWRGAEIEHIVNFKKTFPTATIKRLETNYRSTSNILNAANSLIKHNSDRYDKVLHTYNVTNNGEPVYVLSLPSDREEAQLICDYIKNKSDGDYSKFAIMARSEKYWTTIEKELVRCAIPYKVLSGTKFYSRTEIKDVLSYIRLLVVPSDDIAFKRVIGKPSRQIGPKAIEKIKQAGSSLMLGLRGAILSSKQRLGADEFLYAFDFDWQSMSPQDAVKELLQRSGYLDWLSKDENFSDKLERINFLIDKVVADYETLGEFLDFAALKTNEDDENTGNYVSLMTIHAAKGLEFDTVFLPAWEENLFPNKKTLNTQEVSEERRLAYVAITRAKKICVISYVTSRWMYGEAQSNSPSRFITEMDNRYLDFQGGAPRARTYYAPTQCSYDAPTRPRPAPIQNNTFKGKFVTHQELGSGVVIEDDGNILTIAFKNKGIKKVARQFVTVN